jgi:tRNA-splicing endonuclease subunit Sen34
MASEASTSKERLVEISVINGEAYVWSAASIALLRCNYGIVGMLTGSLPLIPQQNAFLGVPLQLFEEEVVYLLRRGAVVLVDDTKAHDVQALSGQELDQWHEQRVASISNKRRMAIEEARVTKEKLKQKFSLSESAMEKKRLREERKRTQGGAQDKEEDLFAKLEQAADEAADEANVSHSITIPSTSSNLEWYNVQLGENAFGSLSSAARAGLWHYPSTANQRARCAAFDAFRAKEYYMGKGLRFGGDFVVYPGESHGKHSYTRGLSC